MQINESTLDFLRTEITKYISGKRLSHSLAVEQEAKCLGQLFSLSESDIQRLRAAAILHDITKELTTDNQIRLCQKYGVPVSEDDLASPKIFHSVTGAYYAKEHYPEYVDEDIFNAILYHTTGRPEMTLSEKLIYLADYIEPTRTFDDCVKLRDYFYSEPPSNLHLAKTMLMSFDMTIKNLIDENFTIHGATVKARNSILKELKNYA